MSTVTEIEAENHFRELLSRVRRGEEVLITSEKDASVRMALEDLPSVERSKKAAANLRALRARIASRPGAKPLSSAEIREIIEEGRR